MSERTTHSMEGSSKETRQKTADFGWPPFGLACAGARNGMGKGDTCTPIARANGTQHVFMLSVEAQLRCVYVSGGHVGSTADLGWLEDLCGSRVE